MKWNSSSIAFILHFVYINSSFYLHVYLMYFIRYLLKCVIIYKINVKMACHSR